MTYFRFKILRKTGRVSSGVIQLPYDNVLSAMSHLERGNDTIIFVKKLHPFLAALLSFFVYGFQGNSIKRSELAEFFNNVSVMLKAGIPLLVALKDAGEGLNKGRFSTILSGLIIDVESGATLSEALAKHPRIFQGTVVHLITIGEETGTLDRMLLNCSLHLKKIDEIIRNTKQAMIYPSIVLTLITGGMLFWFYSVVPKILTLFDEMEVELPPLTKAILWVSEYVQEYIFTLLAVSFISILLIYIGNHSSITMRKFFQQTLIRMPVFKTIIIASNLAFITEYFSLLLNAGIDVVRSVKILSESVSNEIYREKMLLIGARLASGYTIAESFTIRELFPAFVLRMIKVGEQSGSLPEQLEYIADDYRTRLSTVVETIGKLIEPVVLVIAGGMFAVILAGLFLPIYDLVSQVGTQ